MWLNWSGYKGIKIDLQVNLIGTQRKMLFYGEATSYSNYYHAVKFLRAFHFLGLFSIKSLN